MAGTKAGAAKARAKKALRALEATSPAPSVTQGLPAPAGGLETRSKPREPYLEVGRKPIKHGKRVYRPGTLFPARIAATVPRLEGWLRTGMLVQR